MMDFERQPMIYVAGPYKHPDVAANVHIAIEYGKVIAGMDAFPYVPHLCHLWHLIEPQPEAFWLEMDLQPLVRSDALFRFPGESRGADREEGFARRHDIPIFRDDENLQRFIDHWLKTRMTYLYQP